MELKSFHSLQAIRLMWKLLTVVTVVTFDFFSNVLGYWNSQKFVGGLIWPIVKSGKNIFGSQQVGNFYFSRVICLSFKQFKSTIYFKAFKIWHEKSAMLRNGQTRITLDSWNNATSRTVSEKSWKMVVTQTNAF